MIIDKIKVKGIEIEIVKIKIKMVIMYILLYNRFIWWYILCLEKNFDCFFRKCICLNVWIWVKDIMFEVCV